MPGRRRAERFGRVSSRKVPSTGRGRAIRANYRNERFAERVTTTSGAFSRGFLEETDEFGERADNGADRSRAIRTTSRNAPGLWQRQLPPFGQHRLSFLPGLAKSTYHAIHKMVLR